MLAGWEKEPWVMIKKKKEKRKKHGGSLSFLLPSVWGLGKLGGGGLG